MGVANFNEVMHTHILTESEQMRDSDINSARSKEMLKTVPIPMMGGHHNHGVGQFLIGPPAEARVTGNQPPH